MQKKQISLSLLGKELQRYTMYKYDTDEQPGEWYEKIIHTYSVFGKFVVNEFFPESLTLMSNSSQVRINHINKIIQKKYSDKCVFELYCNSPLCESTERVVISAV